MFRVLYLTTPCAPASSEWGAYCVALCCVQCVMQFAKTFLVHLSWRAGGRPTGLETFSQLVQWAPTGTADYYVVRR
jgi:hypothetical protein